MARPCSAPGREAAWVPANEFALESIPRLAPMGSIVVLMDTTPAISRQKRHAPRTTIRDGMMRLDLHEDGARLVAIAKARQLTTTGLVRLVLAHWLQVHAAEYEALGMAGAAPDTPSLPISERGHTCVDLWISAHHAQILKSRASAAELSRSMYVVSLLEGMPAPPLPPDLKECRADLVRSNARLAALSSDVRALTRLLLSQTPSPEVTHCQALITQWLEAVNQHLVLTAPLVAALHWARRSRACDAVRGEPLR